LRAVDTSVVVAAFASWHEGHVAALAALKGSPRLPAHVATEAYSVLTRLPPPHRMPPATVVSFLVDRFDEPWLILPPAAHAAFLREAAEKAITGGALYDALIGATVRHAGATLLTRDRRAARVYDSVGVTFRFVA